jgi:flagellar hook assembly protein FlgD
LVNGSLPPGEYTRTWDGRDDNGNAMASGVYIYEMIARKGKSSSIFKQAKKMFLLR